MAYLTLYQSGALGSGAQLWVTPPVGTSLWTDRIDWYLNFQISRAGNHKPATLGQELLNTLSENNISFTQVAHHQPGPDAPLLIAAQGRLPCDWVLELGPTDSGADWVRRIESVWQELGRPSLRLFLPDGVSDQDLSQLWPAPSGVDITLVPGLGL